LLHGSTPLITQSKRVEEQLDNALILANFRMIRIGEKRRREEEKQGSREAGKAISHPAQIR